jgi:hypothetical protein
MDRVQQANGYDMGGHAVKAEHFLHLAENELDLAVQYTQTH